MIKKRKIIILALIFFTLFIVVIHYFMSALITSESEVRNYIERNYEQQIMKELLNLPNFYQVKSINKDNVTDQFINNLKSSAIPLDSVRVWKEANAAVGKKHLFLTNSSCIGKTVKALKYSKIVKADLDHRGTQLKFILTLEGSQAAVFKPKWYEIDRVIEGPVYAGKDRYNSEILAFYLSAILNKPLAPVAVQRKIHLKNELLNVASSKMLETSFQRRNSTCIYGTCYYCKKEDPICDVQGYLTGVVIFNVGAMLKAYRSPWQRTYKQSKKATWEVQNDYCRTLSKKISKERLFDLVDTAIFDYLMQNGDRHHYETLGDRIVWIDNGKGLGNPYINHIDILAPLYQCCILRTDTWYRLQSLSGGLLVENLRKINEVTEVVTDDHLKSMEKRLLIIYATVEFCRNRNKIKHILF